jgi:hypothetical protein
MSFVPGPLSRCIANVKLVVVMFLTEQVYTELPFMALTEANTLGMPG